MDERVRKRINDLEARVERLDSDLDDVYNKLGYFRHKKTYQETK